MKYIISLSVAFIIISTITLIYVKESNRAKDRGAVAVSGINTAVVKNHLISELSPILTKKDVSNRLLGDITKAILSNRAVSDHSNGSLSATGYEAIGAQEETIEENYYYPDSMKSIGPLDFTSFMEGFYQEMLISGYVFSDENPQWTTFADSSIGVFAKHTLGRELIPEEVDRIRIVFTSFVNRNLSAVFDIVKDEYATVEELENLKEVVAQEFIQIVNEEFDTNISDLDSLLNSELLDSEMLGF